jgi:hypothetical protein
LNQKKIFLIKILVGFVTMLKFMAMQWFMKMHRSTTKQGFMTMRRFMAKQWFMAMLKFMAIIHRFMAKQWFVTLRRFMVVQKFLVFQIHISMIVHRFMTTLKFVIHRFMIMLKYMKVKKN